MADIFQIVKYEGDNSTFIWKSPIEDFNTGTQLIVHESQEAIFFMNGQALDLFGPGRYTLETQNIPLVRKFLNKPTDDQTPFHCEVYFINKTEQMSIKWGTDSQVQYMDPTYKFPLKIGASGEMSLRVKDSRKLLVKIVGTENSLVQAALTSMFRAFLMAKVKPYLAQIMQNSQFGIFKVDSHMGEISNALHKQLLPDFMDYGISLERFLVTTIAKPEGDIAYEKSRDILIRQYSDPAEAELNQKVGLIDERTSAQRMVINAGAKATSRQLERITKQEELAFEVAKEVAKNPSIATSTNAGIGLGMMFGVAGGMGSVVGDITTAALNPLRQQQGAGQNNQSPAAGFGPVIPPDIELKKETTKPAPSVSTSDDMIAFKQKLEKIKAMKEADMLSDEEFEAEKKKLLSSL